MAEYMATGFTKWQFESLKALLSNSLPPAPPPAPPSAPPSALPLCTPALLELTPQPISTPVSAPSYPLSPSVEMIEEVEIKQIYKPLRDIRPMSKKLGALKMTRTSRLPFDEIRIEWPTIFGGSNLCFSRDKDLDVWYTTMLNTYVNELVIWATKLNRA